MQNPLSNWRGTLSVACGQEDGLCDYADLVELGMTLRRSGIVPRRSGVPSQNLEVK